jgi:long-chain fatty acid transport protein
LVLVFLAPQNAKAAGFYIQEQSVKGLGTAFAGSATALDDASTIFFNPAGMTALDSAQINGGVHLLMPSADLDNTGSTFLGAPVSGGDNGNPYGLSPVPNLFAASPLWDGRLWAGIGVTAPFGLGSDYGEDWFGRFDSTETKLTTINVQPSLAYQPAPWFSIGGGFDIQYADAVLKSAVSNGVSNGTSALKGDDISYGYNVGFQIKPYTDTVIGAHYRSAISHTLDGRISVEGLSAGNFNVGGTADLDLPDIATVGIAHRLSPKWRVMAQTSWFGWNSFQTIAPVRDDGVAVAETVQNYQTTLAFAVGAEYEASEKWTLRAGYQFDQTPTTDEFRTSRTPDGDRNWFSAGGTYAFSPAIDLDFAATYIDVADGTIDVNRNSNLARVRANTGGSVGIIALGVNYKF